MTTFALTYDLIKRKDYETLWGELERLSAHRTQDSMWLINLNNTAQEVAEHFRQYIDADDRIWVLELTKNNYYFNAKGGTNDWINNNPPSR